MAQYNTSSKLSTRYFSPNHAQMSTAVKGRDVLHGRRQRKSFRRQEALYAFLVAGLLVLTIGSLFVIAEALL
jgi:hypothetical protein